MEPGGSHGLQVPHFEARQAAPATQSPNPNLMPLTYPALCLHDPLRDPAWRYRRAARLAETPVTPGALPLRTDDEPTQKLLRLVRHLPRLEAYLAAEAAECHDEREWQRLKSWEADILTALRIYYDESPDLAAVVQGGILAGLDDAGVAEQIGATPDVVAWYHRLFFDARDRLGAHDWIVKVIRTPFAARGAVAPASQPPSHGRAVALMTFAYFGGSHALDAVAQGLRHGKPLTDAADDDEWFGETLAHLVQLNAAVAADMLRTHRHGVISLLRLALPRGRARGGRSQRTGKSAEQAHHDIEAMLDVMDAAMGSKPLGPEPAPPEPTAAEAAAAERQAKVQELKDLLMQVSRERTVPSRPR